MTARLTLRAGVWYADGAPCSSYRDALQRTLHAAHIEIRAAIKPAPEPAARPKRAKHPVSPTLPGEARQRESQTTLIERFIRTRARTVIPAESAKTRGAGA